MFRKPRLPLVADMSSTILSRPSRSRNRPHLRGSAKKYRPVGPDHRHRARGSHRSCARGDAGGAQLQAGGGRGLVAEYTADFRLVRGGPRVQMAEETGWPCGHGRAQPGEGSGALRGDRRLMETPLAVKLWAMEIIY